MRKQWFASTLFVVGVTVLVFVVLVLWSATKPAKRFRDVDPRFITGPSAEDLVKHVSGETVEAQIEDVTP
jgi:hypothetical protein